MKREINPIPVIIVAVIAVAIGAYLMFIRPNQEASRIQKEWTTEAAAEARGPGKAKDASREALVQQLQAQEGHANRGSQRRRDRD